MRHHESSRRLRAVRLPVVVCITLATLSGVVLQAAQIPAAQARGTSSWSVSTTSTSTDGGFLDGVSCTGTSACTAVGAYYSGSIEQTQAESWDGTTWTIVSSPDQGSASNRLTSVSCPGSSDCEAVGYYVDPSGDDQTLVESWDGTTWTIVSSPDTGTADFLNSVSCVDSSDCEAVGYYVDPSGTDQTLAESWDGTSWSIVSSPDQGSDLNILNGVSCTSQTSCAAVGYYVDGSLDNSQESLTESYDGTAWTITPSPVGEAGIDYYLRSVSCSGPTSCFAVGSGTLIEVWNGTSWSIYGFAGGYNDLNGVYCVSSTSCAAVGTKNFATENAIEDLERDQVVGRLDSQYSYGRLAGLRELLRLLQLRGGRQLHTVRFVDATDTCRDGIDPTSSHADDSQVQSDSGSPWHNRGDQGDEPPRGELGDVQRGRGDDHARQGEEDEGDRPFRCDDRSDRGDGAGRVGNDLLELHGDLVALLACPLSTESGKATPALWSMPSGRERSLRLKPSRCRSSP